MLNVGAGLSVAGISTFQGTVTGGADFNVTGTVTAGELDATDSSNIGGGQTIGSGLVVGNTVAGSDIRVLNWWWTNPRIRNYYEWFYHWC